MHRGQGDEGDGEDNAQGEHGVGKIEKECSLTRRAIASVGEKHLSTESHQLLKSPCHVRMATYFTSIRGAFYRRKTAYDNSPVGSAHEMQFVDGLHALGPVYLPDGRLRAG